MPAIALLTWLASAALADSRLVLLMESGGVVVVDGEMRPPAHPGQRVSIQPLSAGDHRVQIRDVTGQLRFDGVLQIPDGADVQARWNGSMLQVTTPGVGLGQASATGAPLPTAAYATSAPQPVGGGGSAPTAPAAPASDSPLGSGVLAAGGQVVENMAYNAIPGGDLARGVAGSVAESEAAAAVGRFVAASPAGTRVGTPAPRQLRKPDPAAVTGDVILHNRGGQAMDVYVDGMLAATLGPGSESGRMRVEVGTHAVEIWHNGEVLYRGDLQVDQQFAVDLAWSPTHPPQALNRSWAWAAR